MQFSPYSSPIPLVFYNISFIRKFWRDPPERGRQTRVGTDASGISNSWRFHSLEGAIVLRYGVCGCAYCSNYSAEWISFICEDATLFCNKWYTRQIFFCCRLVFGFCFKADFCCWQNRSRYNRRSSPVQSQLRATMAMVSPVWYCNVNCRQEKIDGPGSGGVQKVSTSTAKGASFRESTLFKPFWWRSVGVWPQGCSWKK